MPSSQCSHLSAKTKPPAQGPLSTSWIDFEECHQSKEINLSIPPPLMRNGETFLLPLGKAQEKAGVEIKGGQKATLEFYQEILE